MQVLLWFQKVVVFLPPGGNECVVGESVWPRSRTDGWAEGLAEVPFSLFLTICLTSLLLCYFSGLCVRVEVSEGHGNEKAFQRSARETPISRNIIRHTVAPSSVNVCVYVMGPLNNALHI